jgi:Flp pilus assembly protein TadD
MARQRRLEILAVAGVIVAAAIALSVASRPEGSGAPAAPASPSAKPRPHAAEIDSRFKQGVVMLHAKQYDHAIAAFHQVLKLAPAMPEAHVNIGFAFVGRGDHAAARDFFQSAIALRPRQANAYYGLAVALEWLGDRPGARGAMRTYLHLTPADDPYRRKGEAALWEWGGG